MFLAFSKSYQPKVATQDMTTVPRVSLHLCALAKEYNRLHDIVVGRSMQPSPKKQEGSGL